MYERTNFFLAGMVMNSVKTAKQKVGGSTIGKPCGPKSGEFGPSGPIGVYGYAHCRLYKHRTRTWYSSGADAIDHVRHFSIRVFGSNNLVAISFVKLHYMNNAVNLHSVHIRKMKKIIYAVEKGAGTPYRHVPSQKKALAKTHTFRLCL